MTQRDYDSELVSKLIKGDIAAFDSLFATYSQKLYAFCLKYLKSKEDAEGLVQDVFLKIWEKRTSLKKEKSFNAFIFTIAYNEVLKTFRTRKYQHILEKEISNCEHQVIDGTKVIEDRSLLDEVDNIIEELPTRRKEIFNLRKEYGLSSKEIAKKLGISAGTVDNNISQALSFIKSKLEGNSLVTILYIYLFW